MHDKKSEFGNKEQNKDKNNEINKKSKLKKYELKKKIKKKSKELIVLIFILLLLTIIIFVINIDFKNESEIEKFSKYEIDNLNFSNLKTYRSNSRGNFFSINENIKVEGFIELEKKEYATYMNINKFKITRNDGYIFYITNNNNSSNYVEIGKINVNIGNFKFELPNLIDDDYMYIVISDKNNEEIVAYGKINN